MSKLELIKGILKLSEELNDSDGIASVMIVDDMIKLVDKYTASQRQSECVSREPIYTKR